MCAKLTLFRKILILYCVLAVTAEANSTSRAADPIDIEIENLEDSPSKDKNAAEAEPLARIADTSNTTNLKESKRKVQLDDIQDDGIDLVQSNEPPKTRRNNMPTLNETVEIHNKSLQKSDYEDGDKDYDYYEYNDRQHNSKLIKKVPQKSVHFKQPESIENIPKPMLIAKNPDFLKLNPDSQEKVCVCFNTNNDLNEKITAFAQILGNDYTVIVVPNKQNYGHDIVYQYNPTYNKLPIKPYINSQIMNFEPYYDVNPHQTNEINPFNNKKNLYVKPYYHVNPYKTNEDINVKPAMNNEYYDFNNNDLVPIDIHHIDNPVNDEEIKMHKLPVPEHSNIINYIPNNIRPYSDETVKPYISEIDETVPETQNIINIPDLPTEPEIIRPDEGIIVPNAPKIEIKNIKNHVPDNFRPESEEIIVPNSYEIKTESQNDDEISQDHPSFSAAYKQLFMKYPWLLQSAHNKEAIKKIILNNISSNNHNIDTDNIKAEILKYIQSKNKKPIDVIFDHDEYKPVDVKDLSNDDKINFINSIISQNKPNEHINFHELYNHYTDIEDIINNRNTKNLLNSNPLNQFDQRVKDFYRNIIQEINLEGSARYFQLLLLSRGNTDEKYASKVYDNFVMYLLKLYLSGYSKKQLVEVINYIELYLENLTENVNLPDQIQNRESLAYNLLEKEYPWLMNSKYQGDLKAIILKSVKNKHYHSNEEYLAHIRAEILKYIKALDLEEYQKENEYNKMYNPQRVNSYHIVNGEWINYHHLNNPDKNIGNDDINSYHIILEDIISNRNLEHVLQNDPAVADLIIKQNININTLIKRILEEYRLKEFKNIFQRVLEMRGVTNEKYLANVYDNFVRYIVKLYLSGYSEYHISGIVSDMKQYLIHRYLI